MNHLTGILETKSGLQSETDLYLGRRMLPTDWALPVPSRWRLAGCFASVYCCRSACSGCIQRPTALFLPFLGPPRVYLNTRISEKHIQMIRKKRIHSWLSLWWVYIFLSKLCHQYLTWYYNRGQHHNPVSYWLCEFRSGTTVILTWLCGRCFVDWLQRFVLFARCQYELSGLLSGTLNYVDFHWKAYFKYSSSRFSTPPNHSKLF